MIYIVILSLLALIETINIFTEYKYKKLTRCSFIIISLIMVFMAAFRDGIGYDFESYRKIYNMIKHNTLHSANISVEPAYFLLNKLCFNFQGVILMSALIGVGIKILMINRYSENKLISLIMYFSGVFIMYDMGVIRQGMSIAIALMSIKYISERNFIKFFAVICIASLFHVSILLFIPLYFISDINLERKFVYMATICVLVISFFDVSGMIVKLVEAVNIPIISSKIAYYASYDTGNITLSLIKRIIFLIIFVEFFKYKNIKDSYSMIFLNGYFLSVLMMGIFSSIDILGGRGTMGLYFLQIFIFAIICKHIETKWLKLVMLCIIVILSTKSMMGPINHGAISNQPYIPYKSII